MQEIETIAENPLQEISRVVLEKQPDTGPGNFLYNHLHKNKASIAIVLCAGIVHSMISFLLTLLIGEFFTLQFNTGSSKGKLLKWLGIEINNLNQFFVLLILLLCLKFFMQYLEKYLTLLQGELFVRDIRNEVFTSQIKNTLDVFGLHRYGNYLLRYSNDMKAVQQYLTKGILAGFRDSLFVIIGLFLFFLLNTSIGIIVAFYLFVAAIGMFFLASRQHRVITNSRNKRSNLLAFVTRSFQRFSSLKEKNKEENTIERFHEKSTELFDANMENAKWESTVESLSGFFHLALIGVLLVLISARIVSVHVSDGLSCILLLLLLQGTVRRLFKVPSFLKKGTISLEKIASLMNAGKI